MRSEHTKTWLMAGMLLIATLASNWSGFDLWLTDRFYDVNRGGFFYRDTFVLAEVLHDWLKKSVVIVWLLMLIRAIQLSWVSRGRVQAMSAQGPAPFFDKEWLVWMTAASALSALIVSVLKSQSAHSCPWYLADYGGTAGYFELWAETRPGPGRCFPSGHASVGWMWLACLIAPVDLARRKWLEHPSKMRWLVATALALGLISSGVQIVRGAHFASHVLATALVCTVVCLLLSAVWPGLQARLSRAPR